MTQDKYTPRPEHKFTFGLWTVGNRGRDPFGDAVRPTLRPVEAVRMLGEIGAYGVNFHDNDLVPIDASPQERDRIVNEFRRRLRRARHRRADGDRQSFLRCRFSATERSLPTTSPFAPTRCKRRCARWILGAEFGAKIFVLWGGREGVGNRRLSPRRRGGEASERSAQLPVRILAGSEIRLQVCAGGEAQRTAGRHLHADHRCLPRH